MAKRILYLQSSFAPPLVDAQRDRFQLLSGDLEGDVLQGLWFSEGKQVEEIFGAQSYPAFRRGSFTYHWYLAWKHSGILRRLGTFWFFIVRGRQLHKEKPFDCIVAYAHMTNGLLGVILHWLTGVPLIIELATVVELAYRVNRPHPTFAERVMSLYSDLCLHITVWSSRRVHLLYPEQLQAYPLLRGTAVSVFPEYVNLGAADEATKQEDPEPYIHLVGAPWYLKGVDVLVEAFRNLSGDYPGLKLKLQGFYPDRTELDQMIGGHPAIEVLPPTGNAETIARMARARIFVLPSRTEGLGRVVMEAMAAGTVVVGSRVGGIPSLVRDGETGLTFPVGDARALELCLRKLLDDPAMRQRMQQLALEVARKEYTESVYCAAFSKMIEDTTV